MMVLALGLHRQDTPIPALSPFPHPMPSHHGSKSGQR